MRAPKICLYRCMMMIIGIGRDEMAENLSDADPGFSVGGGANPPGGRQHTNLPDFPKTCMKLRKCWSTSPITHDSCEANRTLRMTEVSSTTPNSGRSKIFLGGANSLSGCANLFFSWQLHENERIWTSGGGVPGTPLRSATAIQSVSRPSRYVHDYD